MVLTIQTNHLGQISFSNPVQPMLLDRGIINVDKYVIYLDVSKPNGCLSTVTYGQMCSLDVMCLI